MNPLYLNGKECRISVRGRDLVIETNGRRTVRTFETENRAQKEAEKRWKDRVRRGGWTPEGERPQTLVPSRFVDYDSASSRKARERLPYDALAQAWPGGYRCAAHVDSDGKARLCAEKGRVVLGFSTIEDELRQIAAWEPAVKGRLFFDGELWSADGRCTPKIAHDAATGAFANGGVGNRPFKLYLLDVYDADRPEAGFADRLRQMRRLVPLEKLTAIVPLPTLPIRSEPDLRQHARRWQGCFSGAIWRDPNAVYAFGSSDRGSQVFVPDKREEFAVVQTIDRKTHLCNRNGSEFWIDSDRLPDPGRTVTIRHWGSRWDGSLIRPEIVCRSAKEI